LDRPPFCGISLRVLPFGLWHSWPFLYDILYELHRLWSWSGVLSGVYNGTRAPCTLIQVTSAA
jgi:hypothetical protein